MLTGYQGILPDLDIANIWETSFTRNDRCNNESEERYRQKGEYDNTIIIIIEAVESNNQSIPENREIVI